MRPVYRRIWRAPRAIHELAGRLGETTRHPRRFGPEPGSGRVVCGSEAGPQQIRIPAVDSENSAQDGDRYRHEVH